MELKVLKPVKGKRWKKGDSITVANEYGKRLIESGHACIPSEYLNKMAEAKPKPKPKTDKK